MNQSGQTTLDFLFASVLILGTTALIGALSMALTLSEVVQYLTFSASRSYFAGDKTKTQQVEAADKQVAQLKKLPFLTAAISNEWVVLKPRGAKDYSSYAQSKGANLNDRNQFNGYQVELELPLLKIKIPLLGNITSQGDSNDVTLTVSSFLMREPTFDECVDFNNQAFQVLMKRNSNYQSAKGVNFTAINDNGC